jgi:hypothetical protein
VFVSLYPVLDGRPHHQFLLLGEAVGTDAAADTAEVLQGAAAEVPAEFLAGAVHAFQVFVLGVVVCNLNGGLSKLSQILTECSGRFLILENFQNSEKKIPRWVKKFSNQNQITEFLNLKVIQRITLEIQNFCF